MQPHDKTRSASHDINRKFAEALGANTVNFGVYIWPIINRAGMSFIKMPCIQKLAGNVTNSAYRIAINHTSPQPIGCRLLQTINPNKAYKQKSHRAMQEVQEGARGSPRKMMIRKPYYSP